MGQQLGQEPTPRLARLGDPPDSATVAHPPRPRRHGLGHVCGACVHCRAGDPPPELPDCRAPARPGGSARWGCRRLGQRVFQRPHGRARLQPRRLPFHPDFRLAYPCVIPVHAKTSSGHWVSWAAVSDRTCPHCRRRSGHRQTPAVTSSQSAAPGRS